MREILFHGKKTVTGEWVEGSLLTTNSTMGKLFWIVDEFGVEFGVRAKTIGQYTGKTDKNGKRVFTDCIVTNGFDSISGIVRFGEYSNPVADGYHIGFYIEWGGKYHDILRKDLGYWARKENFEVIGNIHDNPELLEDKPDD